MSEEQKHIVELMKRREQDIEIMQLLLKHNLTRKRAEYKLLIMYYKACNMISKAKLVMLGVDDNNVRTHHSLQVHSRHDIKRVSLWDEHFQRQSSDL